MVDQAWKLTMIATLEMERKLETKTSGNVTGDGENTSANSRLTRPQ